MMNQIEKILSISKFIISPLFRFIICVFAAIFSVIWTILLTIYRMINVKRINNLLDAILSGLVAGVLAGGYVNLSGYDAEHIPYLRPLVLFYCLYFSFAILFIKQLYELEWKDLMMILEVFKQSQPVLWCVLGFCTILAIIKKVITFIKSKLNK